MKSIKKFEEFDLQAAEAITLIGISVIIDILILIGFIKYKERIMHWTTVGLHNLILYGIDKMDFMRSLKGGKYSNLTIEENDNTIKIINKLYNQNSTMVEIDKKLKKISFRTFTKKLSDNQYNEIIKLISKYKSSLTQVNDILQEVHDEFNYNIEFQYGDQLVIKLTKNDNIVMGDLENLVSLIEESIDRIEDTFNVRLNCDVSNNKVNYYIFRKNDDIYINDKGSKYSSPLVNLGYLPSYLTMVFDK